MLIITTGRRTAGSGKKPSEETLVLRELIIDILKRKSRSSMARLRMEVGKNFELKDEQLKRNIISLVRSGDVVYERENCRYGIYSLPKPSAKKVDIFAKQPGNAKGVKLPSAEGMPHIKRVPANKLPKLSGPIYAPMDWIVHQLQGAS